MRIDRWNAGRMRRYHLPSGTIAVVSRQRNGRRCAVLPAFCHHISVEVSPEATAQALKEARANV